MDTSPLNLSIRQTPHVDARRSAPRRVFGWILGVAGAGVLLLGADEFRRSFPALTWPSVPGRVQSARISSDTVATNVGKWRNSPIVEPRIHVSYQYQVAGTAYTGRQLDLLPPSRRNARADLRRYPAGTPVSVRYDPDRPTDAVLEAPWPLRAAVTAVVGLAILSVAWRLARRRAAIHARAA